MNISDLIHNYVLNCAVIAWAAAQVIKTLLVLFFSAIATCRAAGFASVEFAITFVLASVVMYDALNVRRQAGEHAKAINEIATAIDEIDGEYDLLDIAELKEQLGHKPMEVLAGALLGILTAMILPM